MTTQHLEEAEELSDQVALLDLGKLVSKGSVDEIKKKFGIGYNLSLTKDFDEKKIIDIIPGSYKN